MLNIHLKIGNITIRRTEEEDLKAFIPLFTDPKILYYYIPEEISLMSEKEILEYLADWDDNESSFLFTCLEEERIVAFFTLENYSEKQKNTECGIAVLDPEDYGKGYATKIIRTMLDYLFHNQHLHKVYIRYIEGNIASRKLFEKLNFKKEGTFREHIKRGNQYLDLHYMSILNREW